jgi:diguanylate cyclase (GGDEF)-like protein
VPQLATSWSAQQLTEFLAQVSVCADEASASRVAIERAAEAIDAEAGAMILGDEVVASIGFTAGRAPHDALLAAARRETESLYVPGVGACPVLIAPLDDDSGALVLARLDDDGFSREEEILLRGMARVLSLTRLLLRGLEDERALREESERQADENIRLLKSLAERQALLERLSRIQRSIVHRAALDEVLDAIVAGARDLLREDVAAVRLLDPHDPTMMDMVSSSGVREDLAAKSRRSPVGSGAGGRAISEGRLVIIEDYEHAPDGMIQFAAEKLQAAMAAPVLQNGEVVGSLLVASYKAGRRYSELEQEVLMAFAEHTSLALTDAKNFDDALHRAFHDALTGLPNRPLFLDRLQHALARAPRAGRGVAVLFLDVDRFKSVNDRFGHAAGDELLMAVARRVEECVRPGDTVARFGGDEFAVLVEDVGEEQATAVAGRILAALEAPFSIHEKNVFVSASVGIAAGRRGPDELMRNADLAMYKAKSSGKGRYERFEPNLHAAVVERLELEVELRAAVENEEFVLHYQPIFSLERGAIVGVEALLRWIHPERGTISPADFVPLAEETRLILPIGRWVLTEACRRGQAWNSAHGGGLAMCVNISAQQLDQPGLVDDVAHALAKSGLPAEKLVLEITETLLMQDTEATISKVTRLKELGIQLAVDDFGTGYSSLQYLNRFPIDILKIAKSFVDGLAGDTQETALVRAITDLADNFSLRVVAEGIESPEQVPRLLALGCELAQGFHFSVPLEDEAVGELLRGPSEIGAWPAPAGRHGRPSQLSLDAA